MSCYLATLTLCLDGGDEGRVEERGGEDDGNILKINTFHKSSPLLSSPLPPSPFFPNIPLRMCRIGLPEHYSNNCYA